MNKKRVLPWIIAGIVSVSVAALGLLIASPAQASDGWGFGIAYSPSVVASCTSYNIIPARVDVPSGAYAGYITGRLSNTRAGSVRKPALGVETVYNAGSPTQGYLIFNPPEGTVEGDVLHVTLTLYSDPALTSQVGSFDFSYRCSTGEVVHTAGYPGDPINIGYGDNLVVLARGADAQGSPDVKVWCLDPQGYASTIGMTLSKASLSGLSVNPSSNTLIDQNNSCLVSVSAYLLTTGEYQVTIGPDTAGVVNQIIFSGLPPTGIHALKTNLNQD